MKHANATTPAADIYAVRLRDKQSNGRRLRDIFLDFLFSGDGAISSNVVAGCREVAGWAGRGVFVVGLWVGRGWRFCRHITGAYLYIYYIYTHIEAGC